MEYKNIAVGVLISLLPNFSHAMANVMVVDLPGEKNLITRLRSAGCEDNAQLNELVSRLKAYSSINMHYLIGTVRRKCGYNAHQECRIMQELCKNNEKALAVYAASEYEKS